MTAKSARYSKEMTNHKPMRKLSSNAGFTLIELMVVVVLVAILVTIAVPSYKRSIAKADRSIAISDLNKVSQSLERYYSLARPRAYSTSFIDLGLGADAASITSTQGEYTLTVSHTGGNTQTFVVQAVPTTLSADTYTLTLDHLGRKKKKNEGEAAFSDGWPH